jgi:hypothetical protein
MGAYTNYVIYDSSDATSRQRVRPYPPNDDEKAGGSMSKNHIKVLSKVFLMF